MSFINPKKEERQTFGQSEARPRAINNNDNNIYLFLLNKYRRENKLNFNEYLKKVSAMKQDEKWNELTEDEQQSIICEI